MWSAIAGPLTSGSRPARTPRPGAAAQQQGVAAEQQARAGSPRPGRRPRRAGPTTSPAGFSIAPSQRDVGRVDDAPHEGQLPSAAGRARRDVVVEVEDVLRVVGVLTAVNQAILRRPEYARRTPDAPSSLSALDVGAAGERIQFGGKPPCSARRRSSSSGSLHFAPATGIQKRVSRWLNALASWSTSSIAPP